MCDCLNDSEINLHRMQFGFRKHHSTETAICCFAEQIKSYLDNGGVVGAVFLDSTEAPGNVNHNVLLSKISKSIFFFSVNILKWMESYLRENSELELVV